MLGVLDEDDLELMSGTLHDTFDCCGVESRHCCAGEGGEGEGSAGHPHTVCREGPLRWKA